MPIDKWNEKISQLLSALRGQEDGVGYFGVNIRGDACISGHKSWISIN